jgi:hypothetical protein
VKTNGISIPIEIHSETVQMVQNIKVLWLELVVGNEVFTKSLFEIVSQDHERINIESMLYSEWTKVFPTIRPFYAVKCNPHPLIVERMARLGAGFDCASPVEIDIALQFVEPEDVLYAHSCALTGGKDLVEHVLCAGSPSINQFTT